jgi:hypothetical protein
MKSVILLFCALILSSCGKYPFETKRFSGKQEEIIYPTTYSNTPIFLEKQNKNCGMNSFAGNKNLNLHLYFQGKRKLRSEDFAPLLYGLQLNNNLSISHTYFDERIEIFYEGETSTKGLSYSSPKDVTICPEDDGYAPNTIESASLNASFFINKTFNKFTSVIHDVLVAPITLNIAPSILKSFILDLNGEKVKMSRYMTDNAFYMPGYNNVTFLPQSQDGRNMGLKINFWEIPMVASHEYGHHLFQSIFPVKIKKSLGMVSESGCFGNTQEVKIKKQNLSLRRVKIENVVDAYNEGFADLISFYSLDKDERDVRDVKCLEVSRDTGSPKFYNGKAKKFTREVLTSYFAFVENAPVSCNEVNYQESHTLGSIFAHNVDLFLGYLTDSNDEKLVAVVDWVKYLKDYTSEHDKDSAENYLKQTFSEFIRMSMSKFNRKYDESICKRISAIYTDLDMKECSALK